MPIFEYKCKHCGNCFEQLVRSGDESIFCPGCGSNELLKLFSSFALGSTEMVTSAGTGCSSCSTRNCSSCK